MTDEDHPLSVMVELALANAKRSQRELRAAIQDMAQIRDYLTEHNVQTEGGHNENDRSSNTN